MKKQPTPAKPNKKQINSLAETVGNFIRYWGFRRIHGQIWTLLYLSPTPLSGAAIVAHLGVSKALVSAGLGELEEHGLIRCFPADKKTKLYSPCEDVLAVMTKILSTREKKILQKAQEKFAALEKNPEGLHLEHLKKLGMMIHLAPVALNFLISQMNEEALSQWLALAQEGGLK